MGWNWDKFLAGAAKGVGGGYGRALQQRGLLKVKAEEDQADFQQQQKLKDQKVVGIDPKTGQPVTQGMLRTGEHKGQVLPIEQSKENPKQRYFINPKTKQVRIGATIKKGEKEIPKSVAEKAMKQKFAPGKPDLTKVTTKEGTEKYVPKKEGTVSYPKTSSPNSSALKRVDKATAELTGKEKFLPGEEYEGDPPTQAQLDQINKYRKSEGMPPFSLNTRTRKDKFMGVDWMNPDEDVWSLKEGGGSDLADVDAFLKESQEKAKANKERIAKGKSEDTEGSSDITKTLKSYQGKPIPLDKAKQLGAFQRNGEWYLPLPNMPGKGVKIRVKE